MDYSESMEMYLETILELSRQNQDVHSVDVARTLDVSKPSVNRALGILKSDGMILQPPYGSIRLTEIGLKAAKQIKQRHDGIASFLVRTLGINRSLAEQDACRIEHIISSETFEAILDFNKGAN